jgi:hypothetical protein
MFGQLYMVPIWLSPCLVLGKKYFTHLDIGTKVIRIVMRKLKFLLPAVPPARERSANVDRLTASRDAPQFPPCAGVAGDVRNRECLLWEVC